MRLRRLAFVCAIGASVLAACGNNGLLNTGTSTATQSAIRFINGSPDLSTASGVDVYLNGVSAGVTQSALTYLQASKLTYITSAQYTIVVTPHGASSTTSLSCTTSSLAANTRYTVVIAGKVANSTLQCQIFPETVYSLPSGAFQLSFHNASPALNAVSPSGAGFGTFANSSPPVYNNEAGPVATFTSPAAGGTIGPVVQSAVSVNTLPAGVLTAPGLGVYVSKVTNAAGNPNPPTSADVISTILPSQLQAGFSTDVGSTCDPNNTYPIQAPSATPTPASTTAPTPSPTPSPSSSACPASSTLMSVYAVDGPAGGPVAQLVGVTD